MLRRDARHADAHFLLGMVAVAAGAIGRALPLIDKALELAPDTLEYLAQSARCLALLHRNTDALDRVDRALAGPVDDPRVLDTLGVVCARAGAHERAAELFRQAQTREPGNAGIAFNLGSALKFLGRFDESETAFERTLEIDPGFVRAYPALASLRRQTPERNHIARFEAALAAADGNVDAELRLRHALAKELEDLGRYREAFAHLEAGNAKKRAEIHYEIAADVALFDAVIDTFPAGAPQAPPGHRSREPIFVVGMPRSGTTLVERILSAHPDVSSAGELQNFGVALKRLAGTTSPRVLDPATVAAGMRVDPALLGRTYVEDTRPLTGVRPHFVDKMPLNFFYLGFVRRALPEARIVCLRRGALDTCLSNFRQLFAEGLSYYNYAHSLATAAEYYVQFDRLVAHWRATLGDALLELKYESLVAEPEAQIRKLLAHCDLSFDPACLAFDRNASPVATASAVQVREPLNAASIGRWRRYGNLLNPAIDVLLAAGLPLDA